MKLKLEQVYNATPSLVRISHERFPVNLAWRIQRNLKLIEPEGKHIETLLLELARDKYQAKETAPGFFKVGDEYTENFEEEKKTLLDNEIELGIALIPLADFTHDISPADLNNLEWMFTFPPDESDKAKTSRKRHGSKKDEE